MTKNVLVGLALAVGGIVLGGVAVPPLMARIASNEALIQATGSQQPTSGTVAACQDTFRQAELDYKKAMRDLQVKREAAVKTRNQCVQEAVKTKRSESPKPSRSPSSSPSPSTSASASPSAT